MNYDQRVRNLQTALGRHDVVALLVTNLTNVRYLTGFSGTNAQLLLAPDRVVFFTDPRYAARARALVRSAEVVVYASRLSEILPNYLPGDRLGIEATTMSVAEKDELNARLASVDLVPTQNLIEERRRIKDPDEAKRIEDAVRLGDAAFEWALSQLRPGMQEGEIALAIEIYLRSAGAEDVSFPPIVASGPLSAHIHHSPTERELRLGDVVLLDFGCRIDGYCSDLTRTVVLGAAPGWLLDLYQVVLEAQRVGVEAAAAGRSAAEVDGQARRIIVDSGHGTSFGHGLGHGVGLAIHEAPRLHFASDDDLKENDVVTVEPGIYLRDQGGVRIEDCVMVTTGPARVLSSSPKADLLVI